jgi:uncharacterized protein (TIGR02145 family)
VLSYNATTGSGSSASSKVNTTYRVYLNPNQMAGTYVGQVKYSILNHNPNTSFSLYMQDFTPEMCETLGTSTEKYLTLYDRRDGNSYTVAYINGSCWMTQNLRITGTISSQYSNFIGPDINISQEDLDMNTPTNTTCIPSNPAACNSYDTPMTHNSNNATNGVWYNYVAATAGTITGASNTTSASQDICPAGWRLPTDTEQSSILDYTSAFSPVAGNRYDRGVIGEQLNYGYWWSNVAFDSQFRYFLRYSDSVLNNDYAYGLRVNGYYIRCILQPTMQGATSSSLASLMPNDGDGTSMIDSRDNNSYTIRRINGQYWMINNLRLTGTVSADKSNFTGSDFNVSQYSLDSSDASYSGHCDMANGVNYACSKDSGSKETGVRYNYAAATAGTITGDSNSTPATQDICPSGWHLPSGPNTTEGTDFNKFFGNTTTGWQSATGTQMANFNPVYGGYLINGGFSWVNYGFWWSSTPSAGDEDWRRLLIYYNSQNDTFKGDSDANTNRGCGYFIRCVRD